MTTPALELRDIHKHYGSVHALRGAVFTLMPGELHALLGENGAGKTTLMHVAYGLTRPDRGEVLVNGSAVSIGSPRVARRLGIGMVHQHFTAIPALTVAENVALSAGWPVTPAPLRTRVRALSEHIGLPLEPDAVADSLSVGLKQRLEIVKALATDTRVLLLDEPTAVLAPGEAEEMLRVVRGFTTDGGSAVLITHKLDEALSVADRVTVIRQGSVTFTGPTAGQTAASLAEAMVGSEFTRGTSNSHRNVAADGSPPGPALIVLERVDIARPDGTGTAVRDASLAVHAGEIVGIAAVEGNGQRELLRVVAGRERVLRGRLEVAGPVGFIPEDRTTEGLIPELSLTENIVLGFSDDAPWRRGRGIDWRAAGAYTSRLLADYGIVASGQDAAAATLSGGNQQKLVLGRELAGAPRVVVAEDPTRGLDVRAAESIHERIRAVAAAGAAVLFHSSDLDEVLALADRVLVMSRGSLVVPPDGASRVTVGELMVTDAR